MMDSETSRLKMTSRSTFETVAVHRPEIRKGSEHGICKAYGVQIPRSQRNERRRPLSPRSHHTTKHNFEKGA